MKTLATVSLLLCVYVGFAQKCKYKKNEVDKFTKNRVVTTKEKGLDLTMGSSLTVQAKVINEFTYLEFRLITGSVFSMTQGNKVIILFSNDSTLTLENMKTFVAEPSGAGPWVGWVKTSLTEDQIQTLYSYDVKSVRVYTTQGYLTREVKEKNVKNIQYVLNCVQNPG